jgi:probable HAF family extracellular repeat protein
MKKTALVMVVVLIIACHTNSFCEVIGYDIELLGTLGGTRSWAYGINDLGQVVGESITSDGYKHAFLWENGSIVDLGILGEGTVYGTNIYNVSCARSINNMGQIVGYSSHDGSLDWYDDHAFLWENGSMIDMGTLGGANSYATAINNLGSIAGHSKTSDEEEHAFQWINGVMTDIGSLGGSYYAMTQTTGNNDNGQIVGVSTNVSENRNAFLWQDGQMTDLGAIDEYGSKASAINNMGQIVGSVTFRRWITPSVSFIDTHAVLWEDGIMNDLGVLDFQRSYAMDINEEGQIVGYSYVQKDIYGGYDACLWENGEIINLHDFFPEELGFKFSHATGINNLGQIIGYGEIEGNDVGFIMTPIPEPATILLFGLGGLVLRKRWGQVVSRIC